ncbi:MAG: hypothetical protein IB617_00275 [Candidatus Nealsonbacteria bacterium]|nr:MAG: hypothetical protein IB617_00275 [Candidatus Nealsonbacteria bacterium]
MEIKSSWMVLVSIIVIVVLIGCALFVYYRYIKPETQTETPSETSYQLDPTYPRYLIEGIITSVEINPPEGKFKIEVDINKIFLDELSFTKEVTVLTDKETEFVFYKPETKKETPATIEDFEIGAPVVIAIKESNSNILSEDTFTSIKMTRMLGIQMNIQ